MAEWTQQELVWLDAYKAAMQTGKSNVADAEIAAHAVMCFNAQFNFIPTATTNGFIDR